MTDLAAIRERIEVLAVLSKGYRPLGMHDGLERARLSTLCDAIDELAALLADTPSVEPRETDFDLLLRRAYANGHRDGLECGGPLAASECDHVGSARLLPTQASDSPEKT